MRVVVEIVNQIVMLTCMNAGYQLKIELSDLSPIKFWLWISREKRAKKSPVLLFINKLFQCDEKHYQTKV